MATEIDEYRLSERRYRVPDRTSTDLNTEILEIRRVETPYSQNRRAETPYSQVSWTEHVSRRATVDGTERTASSDHWGGLHGNFGRPVGAFVDNGRDSRTQRIVHVSTHVVHGGVSLSLPACLSVSLSACLSVCLCIAPVSLLSFLSLSSLFPLSLRALSPCACLCVSVRALFWNGFQNVKETHGCVASLVRVCVCVCMYVCMYVFIYVCVRACVLKSLSM